MVHVPSESAFATWITALDERHLADLTLPEVGRALRALSSCYVERRSRLAEGAALEGAGKRAAFALFYAPLHFQTTSHIVRELAVGEVSEILDLGCGTGAAGAAWALAAGERARVSGFDRSAWAVAEANWTYQQFGLRGRASRQDLTRVQFRPHPGQGILAAYAINELSDSARAVVLPRLVDAGCRGAPVLVIEPIARRLAPWWGDWQSAFIAAGGRADEWRLPSTLPARQRQLAKSAGLNPQELTARTLFLDAGANGPAGALR
jgi:SAM-dependent methyltransferase